jgi:hypothetical protein
MHLVEMEQCTLKYKMLPIFNLLRILYDTGQKGKFDKMKNAFWIFN